jgi:hypothetical protein
MISTVAAAARPGGWRWAWARAEGWQHGIGDWGESRGSGRGRESGRSTLGGDTGTGTGTGTGTDSLALVLALALALGPVWLLCSGREPPSHSEQRTGER